MATSIKTLLGVLLVGCLATFAVFVFGGQPDRGMGDPGLGSLPGGSSRTPSGELGAASSGSRDEAGVVAGGNREALGQVKRVGLECRQGVRGRLLGPSGAGVVGAKLYLIPGIGGDLVKAMERQRRGVVTTPIAMTVSNARGDYALGVDDWREGGQFDIHILHPDFCDAKVKGLEPQPDDWVDVGTLRMRTGGRVFGLVTDRRGGGIVGAEVRVLGNQSLLLGGVAPGRERGLIATTDAGGRYRIEHVDPLGIQSLSVTAVGYGKAERRGLAFGQQTDLQVDFELGRGSEITGTVFDPNGKPVDGAAVMVSALSQKLNLTRTATTDATGAFKVCDLDGGAYALLVKAEGFQHYHERPFQAGDTDLEIMLEKLGAVLVTALDSSGRPVGDFRCNIKAVSGTAEGSYYGRVVLGRDVRNAGLEGMLIEGLRPMTYVAEVHLAGHAKNFSEPFEIKEAAEEPPRVIVQLNLGGRMTGRVVDGAGQPVAGAKVRTRPFGAIDNPITKLFPMPYRITRSEVITNARGQFTMSLLHPGAYQLRVAAPSFCSGLVTRVEVRLGESINVGDLEIVRGCQVSGVATLKGRPAGQIKVTATMVQSPGEGLGMVTSAVSDNAGRFVFPKRLPPGKFQIMGANQLNPNVFVRMGELKQSTREFTVARTDQVLRVDVAVARK